MRFAILSAAMLAAILVPFFLWGDALEAWATAYVHSGAGRWQMAAVIAALLASDIVLPVPASILSVAAGSLLGFTLGTATSWVGLTAGCLLGYALGKRSGGEKLLSAKERERLQSAQSRYGDWMLILFRAVPVLAEASVFFAGLTRMPWLRFAAITAVSNLGVSAAYGVTGAFFAGREAFLWAFSGAVLLPAVALIVSRKIS